MPITRRKRANPPDQPENNSNHLADQTENSPEALLTERPADVPVASDEAENATTTPATGRQENVSQPAAVPPSPPPVLSPMLPSGQTFLPPPVLNGDRGERGERSERQDYSPIEGGRRTARGELFRRPPQPPPSVQPVPVPPLQAPSHEIKLPLGKELGDTQGDSLHLSYNPGYTGSDEARSALLQKLAAESKAGGRARCWNCGSLAIVYDRWNTRSKTFGEVGIAFCEICGVWSVM